MIAKIAYFYRYFFVRNRIKYKLKSYWELQWVDSASGKNDRASLSRKDYINYLDLWKKYTLLFNKKQKHHCGLISFQKPDKF